MRKYKLAWQKNSFHYKHHWKEKYRKRIRNNIEKKELEKLIKEKENYELWHEQKQTVLDMKNWKKNYWKCVQWMLIFVALIFNV